jgi:hypothetical protein
VSDDARSTAREPLKFVTHPPLSMTAHDYGIREVYP